MIKTVKELIEELSKYPKDMKVYSNGISQNALDELVIEHERSPEEEELYQKQLEKLRKAYNKRMDRRGEITSFANRW